MKSVTNHRPASPRSRPLLFMTKSQQPSAKANASTGPRSAAGKARSSMNALKTGIYSKSLIILGEVPADLTTLIEEYFQRFNPTLPEQRDLVDILVRSTWTLRRLAVAEAQIYTHGEDRPLELDEDAPIGHIFGLFDRTLSRLQRMINSTQRNFRDALRDLERIHALPLDTDPLPPTGISTDSPNPKPGPTLVPDPQPTSQPVETKPVRQSKEFVSSTRNPPRPAPPKTASKAPREPLPFHQPGSHCHPDAVDREKYKRCPTCFPEDCHPDARE
jgi:hypothetical protein